MQLPARAAREEGGSCGAFLLMLLILACVVLGAVLSWGIHERTERAVLSVRNEKLANAYIVVLAKRSDLASILTDQRTHLYRLRGEGTALGQWATVAWQAETGRGVVLGEHVPAIAEGRYYVLWHVDQNQKLVKCGWFREDVTGTFYDFGLRESVASTAGFRVSVESNSDVDKPGQIVYETN
jgi:hypothetical protein